MQNYIYSYTIILNQTWQRIKYLTSWIHNSIHFFECWSQQQVAHYRVSTNTTNSNETEGKIKKRKKKNWLVKVIYTWTRVTENICTFSKCILMTFDSTLQYILQWLFSLGSLLSLLTKYSCLSCLHEVFVPNAIRILLLFSFFTLFKGKLE
jgi:pheromone shutdown protein TraB